MMMNATIFEIDPGYNPDYESTNGNIQHTIGSNITAAGDTIVLRDGIYVENYSISIKHPVVIMADKGARPIVQAASYFGVYANVKVIGVTFKGTGEYAFYVQDATPKSLIFEDCEFSGYSKFVITGSSSKSDLDSCVINNCYFHDTERGAVQFESSSSRTDGQNSCQYLKVTNTTITNISALSGAIIDLRNKGAVIEGTDSLFVDHVTIYNWTGGSNGAIMGYKTKHVGIYNTIIAQPASNSTYGVYCYGGYVKNCLANNVSHRKWDSYPTFVNEMSGDPLFVDAENGNYALSATSPAIGAALDGSNLGDPRWNAPSKYAHTDFSTPYAFTGDKAGVGGNVWRHADGYLYYNDKSVCGTAIWGIHATKACAVKAQLNMNAATSTGHTFKVYLIDAKLNKIDSVAEKSQASTGGNIDLNGTMYIPAEGDYFIKLHNLSGFSSAIIDGVTLSYAGGAVQSMPGTTNIDEAWFSLEGTRADGKIDFPNGTIQNGWVKWNVKFTSAANYDVQVTVNSNNCKNYTVALLDANGNDVVTPLSKSDCSTKGTPVTLEMGSVAVPAGTYVLKVTNGTKDSDAELISVKFIRKGGGLINIPDDLTFDEVVLSERALVDNDSILFTARGDEGHNSTEYAKWYIHANAAGQYKFTINAYNPKPSTAQRYKLIVLATNELDTIATIRSAWNNKDNEMIASIPAELEIGNYIFKVQNTEWGSWGRLMSAAVSYEGGATINIPNATIPLNEAILKDGATRDSEGLHFKNDQYVVWNIHAAEGLYTFSATCTSSNYSNLTIKVKQGVNEIYSYTPQYTYKEDGKVISSPQWVLEAGDYILELSNPTSGNGYVTALAATAPEGMLILNENKTDDGSIATADYSTTSTRFDVYLKRSFTAGKYYTICVPFDSYDSQLESRFGTGYELWKMVSAEQVGEEINLNFEQINGDQFAAGVPYIIKPTKNVENPTFSQKKILNNSTTRSFDAANFIGTFYKDEIPAGESNLYLQNNELFYNESHDTPIKGTRAWIQLKPQGQSAPKARIVMQGNVATEINLVNGEIVEGTVKTIENGQLIIIRDGQKFNVMGAKIQ